jgi:hypothetical protein
MQVERKTMALTVKSFSIGLMMDVNSRMGKQSEFLNMKFESDVSLTPEQAMVHQLEAHKIVEEAIVFNALAAGMITKETAKDKLDQIKVRHGGILSVLQEKYGTPDPASFLDSEDGSGDVEDVQPEIMDPSE